MRAADDRWHLVQREELMEVARSNNFVIKYDKFDWNLHLTKVCLSRSSTSLRECMHPLSSLAFGCRVVDWSHAHARRRARRRRAGMGQLLSLLQTEKRLVRHSIEMG